MTILSIAPPTNPRGRCKITFSDGKVWRILPDIVAEFGLFTGMELEDGQLAALKKASDTADTKRRAVNILSATSVSSQDLSLRLKRGGASEEDAEHMVTWLSELNLLDDARTARQIVERGVRKGYGVHRIRQMLYEKKIPREYWDAALEAMPPMDDAIDAYLDAHLSPDADEKEQKRTVDALMRRGYSWEQIKEGLRRYGARLADTLEED